MTNEKPKFKIFDPVADIAAKFDFYIKIVIAILVVAVLTMLFMVATMLIDVWKFKEDISSERKNEMVLTEQSAKINELSSSIE